MKPHLPEPEDCESLSFDAYSGMQMLSYGSACFDAGYAAGRINVKVTSNTLDELALQAARKVTPYLLGSIQDVTRTTARIQIAVRDALDEALAASQAREKVLLEQLESLVLWASRTTVSGCTPVEILYATAALNQPTDDSALTMLLAAERERCAREAERQLEDEPYGHAKFRCANIAAEIRALES